MRKIAMFVDVDNLGLSGRQFKEIFDDVNSAGKIVYGKIYGVIDRKHKEIIDLIVNRGYDMAPPMRVKKRGSKVFDNRILIDVMETVVANEKIDTIAVACAPADLVPLFSNSESTASALCRSITSIRKVRSSWTTLYSGNATRTMRTTP